MKNKDIINKIKNLKLKVSLKSESRLFGSHKSFFKGSGIEFNNLRKYVAGDDVKSIDWKTTAKSNELFIKEFQEEKDLSFYVFFDVSSSLLFSSQTTSKYEMALEIISLFLFSILQSKDKLGLLLFDEAVEKYIPPRSGINHTYKVIDQIVSYQPQKKKTNIEKAIEFFYRKQPKKSFIFLFSDFLFSSKELLSLKNIGKKHKIIAFNLQDAIEKDIPSLGLLNLEDYETGETILMDTSDPTFIKAYKDEYQNHQTAIKKIFSQLKIKNLTLATDENYFKKVYLFFQQNA